MRDRTASRSYSPAAEAFRREHERHRAWGKARYHAARLRRARGTLASAQPAAAAGHRQEPSRAHEPRAEVNDPAPNSTLPAPREPELGDAWRSTQCTLAEKPRSGTAPADDSRPAGDEPRPATASANCSRAAGVTPSGSVGAEVGGSARTPGPTSNSGRPAQARPIDPDPAEPQTKPAATGHPRHLRVLAGVTGSHGCRLHSPASLVRDGARRRPRNCCIVRTEVQASCALSKIRNNAFGRTIAATCRSRRLRAALRARQGPFDAFGAVLKVYSGCGQGVGVAGSEVFAEGQEGWVRIASAMASASQAVRVSVKRRSQSVASSVRVERPS